MPVRVRPLLSLYLSVLFLASTALAQPEASATAAFPEAPPVTVTPAPVPPEPTVAPSGPAASVPVAAPPSGYPPPAPVHPGGPDLERARADRPVIVNEDHSPSRGESWYGWQPLIIDGLSIPLLAASGAGMISYAVGGPVVHLAHGRPGAALGSAGLRLGLPLVGGMVTLGAYGCLDGGGDLCGLAFIPGAIVGALAAIAIDASVLSWEREPPPPRLSGAFQASVSVKRGDGGRIAVGGTF